MPLPFTSIFRALGRALLLPLLLLLAGGSAAAQTNGGFEGTGTGSLTGWTVTTFLNPGLTGNQPFSGQSIVRNPGGVDVTTFLGAGIDPNVGAVVSYPRFGSYCARVNYDVPNTTNANALSQTFTLTAGMEDPTDNLLHIRFAFLPVLDQSGSHVASGQPYFYVGLKTSGGVTLYDDLNFAPSSGLSGIWQGTGWVYTDWQVRDIALPLSYIGQSVTIEFVASRCSATGHSGYLYVDGVSPTLAGLWVSITADKTKVAANGTITYTYTVRNDSGVPQTGVTLTANPPAQTTLGSSTGLGLYGNLAAGASYTATMTVNVDAGATGTITHDNFFTTSNESAKLYGPTLNIGVMGADTDLQAAVTAVASPTLNRVVYTITAHNAGPAIAKAAQISFALPGNSTLYSAGSSQGSVTGLGPVVAALGDIAVGGNATLTVTVDLTNTNPAVGTATVSGDFVDTTPANDVASATFNYPAPLAITTNPTGGSYLNSTYGGPTVTLTVASSGGWGAPTYQWYRGAAGDTSTPVGTNSTSYTVPTNVDGTFSYWARVSDAAGFVDSQAASVTVFSTHDITTATIGNGTITPGGVVAVTHGTNQTFNIAAGFCYYIRDVVVDGVSQGPITSYTFTNVTTTHTLTATFWIYHYALNYLAGPNGSIVGPNPQSVDCGTDGAPVTAVGTPGSSYTFWRWSDGSQVNPRTDTNVLADLSVTATFATQEEEPNDNYAQATPVSGPGLCVGRVNPANGLPRDSADYWRIVLPQGSTLTATLVPPANGLRYYFYIYNQMGKVMAQSATIRGVANTAVVKNTSGATLYYYVAVRTTSGTSATYYNLNLNW
jgi:uncharacterized repeat protein (TIGR01451 family)